MTNYEMKAEEILRKLPLPSPVEYRAGMQVWVLAVNAPYIQHWLSATILLIRGKIVLVITYKKRRY